MPLTIMLGGWPELPPYGVDGDDQLAEILWKICQQRGHEEHTCPACGDKMCLRCKTGLNV